MSQQHSFKRHIIFCLNRMTQRTASINTDPEFARLFIAVNSKPNEESLETANMLIQNSWNEIFFTSLGIKHIENMMLQCYKIGKIISNFYQKTTFRNLQYSIFHNKEDDNDYISMTVEEFVNQFKHDTSGKCTNQTILGQKTMNWKTADLFLTHLYFDRIAI